MVNENVVSESSDSDSECEELLQSTPPELREIANEASKELLPAASKELYEAEYRNYKEWCQERRVGITSENVLLVYFHSMAKKFAATSLWTKYSFLRATIRLNENLDIHKFTKIRTYLGRKSKHHKTNKAKPFTEKEVQTFFHIAPDNKWFVVKVIMVFGIMGALRVCEIVNIRMCDVEDKGDLYFVRIPETKTGKEKSFTIYYDFYNIVKLYFALRPKNVPHDRVFLNYQNEKCTVQPIGKNKIAKMPREIATFLKLTELEKFKGHSIRRTSASIVGNSGASTAVLKRLGGWASETVAESYVEQSMNSKNQTADIIASKINLNVQGTRNQTTEPIASTSAVKRKNREYDNRRSKATRVTSTSTIDSCEPVMSTMDSNEPVMSTIDSNEPSSNHTRPRIETIPKVPNKIGKFTYKTPKYCHLAPPPPPPPPQRVSSPPPSRALVIQQPGDINFEEGSEFSEYIVQEFTSPFFPSSNNEPEYSLSQYIIEEEITQPTVPISTKQIPYNFNFNNCNVNIHMSS